MAVAQVARPAVRIDTTERINRLEVVLRYAFYIAVTLFLFTPFLMTVLSSFKSSAEVIAYPPTLFPSTWHPENYLKVFQEQPLLVRQTFNGFVVTFVVVALNLFFDAMVGYAGFTSRRGPAVQAPRHPAERCSPAGNTRRSPRPWNREQRI